MIITVGGIKGGSGKTTIATNLAVMRAAEGQDVLLIDADDQETASDFTVLRNERTGGNAGYTSIQLSGAAVRNQTLRLADKYQDIIIWTVQKVAALVNEMKPANAKLTAYTFLNRADSRGQDNDEAAEVLREIDGITFVDAAIGSRKAFSNAAAHGMAVTELRPPDPKASEELMMLYRYVFDTNLVSTEVGSVV